ncbi:hypothetical protein D3C75_1146730 [compost metagenome]
MGSKETGGEQHHADENNRYRSQRGNQDPDQHNQGRSQQYRPTAKSGGHGSGLRRTVGTGQIHHRQQTHYRLAEVIRIRQQAIANIVEHGDKTAHQ